MPAAHMSGVSPFYAATMQVTSNTSAQAKHTSYELSTRKGNTAPQESSCLSTRERTFTGPAAKIILLPWRATPSQFFKQTRAAFPKFFRPCIEFSPVSCHATAPTHSPLHPLTSPRATNVRAHCRCSNLVLLPSNSERNTPRLGCSLLSDPGGLVLTARERSSQHQKNNTV